ncbi:MULTISPECIES: hypothetical protein [Kluyvera]|uniref:hypothetical protein n=1 Tax=Kluyvera TaxID=579 RepID=UPI0038337158
MEGDRERTLLLSAVNKASLRTQAACQSGVKCDACRYTADNEGMAAIVLRRGYAS